MEATMKLVILVKAKYLSRKKVNGKWHYVYETPRKQNQQPKGSKGYNATLGLNQGASTKPKNKTKAPSSKEIRAGVRDILDVYESKLSDDKPQQALDDAVDRAYEIAHQMGEKLGIPDDKMDDFETKYADMMQDAAEERMSRLDKRYGYGEESSDDD
jgi:hypothetical protein